MIQPHLSPQQIIALQHISRWHTRSTGRQQSVAEHSHQVALLALYLAPESTSVEDRLQLLQLALLHDAHEADFGDTPYPAKRALSVIGIDIDGVCRKEFWGGNDPHDQVLPHVRLLVDVADILEAALYAQQHLPAIAKQVEHQAVQAASRLGNEGFVKVWRALYEVEVANEVC